MSPLLPAAPANTPKASETRGHPPAHEGFRELVAGEKRSAGREAPSGPGAADETPYDASAVEPEPGDDGNAPADTKVSPKMFALSHRLDRSKTGADADGQDGGDGQSRSDGETGEAAELDLLAEFNAAAPGPEARQPAMDDGAPAAPENGKDGPPPRGSAGAAAIRDVAAAGGMQDGAWAVADSGELAVVSKEQRPLAAGQAVPAQDAPSTGVSDKRQDPSAGERLARAAARLADAVENRQAGDGAGSKDDGQGAKTPVSGQSSANAQPQADPAAARPAVGAGVAFSVVEAIRNNANWSAFLKAPTAQYREIPNGQGQTLQAIKVQLHPAELGTLTLNLRATGNRISVDIKAEEHAARKLVAGGLDTVARSFQTLGYQVDQVNLAGADGGSTTLDQWGGNRERGETDGRRQDGEYANQAGRDDRAAASSSSDEGSSGRAGGGRTLYI